MVPGFLGFIYIRLFKCGILLIRITQEQKRAVSQLWKLQLGMD